MIGDNDVLLGRGTPINKHEGNINFRNIVKFYKESYLTARNNYEKYLITMEVKQKKIYVHLVALLVSILRRGHGSKMTIKKQKTK